MGLPRAKLAGRKGQAVQLLLQRGNVSLVQVRLHEAVAFAACCLADVFVCKCLGVRWRVRLVGECGCGRVHGPGCILAAWVMLLEIAREKSEAEGERPQG